MYISVHVRETSPLTELDAEKMKGTRMGYKRSKATRTAQHYPSLHYTPLSEQFAECRDNFDNATQGIKEGVVSTPAQR
jgi:hypothetical protein